MQIKKLGTETLLKKNIFYIQNNVYFDKTWTILLTTEKVTLQKYIYYFVLFAL